MRMRIFRSIFSSFVSSFSSAMVNFGFVGAIVQGELNATDRAFNLYLAAASHF
jgi:hypothetical protein